MKLYLNIPQLFYGQLKIGLYNTDMSGKETIKEKKMINHFDDVNLLLASFVDLKLVEPIDDPNEFIVQEDYSWVLGMNTGDEYHYADTGEF